MNQVKKQISLKRSLPAYLLILYGLGTILGAGIYALIGKVAKHAEMLSPWAFLLAATVAFFSALSYAELSSRYPVSGGETIYVKKGFHSQRLSGLTGWLIVFMTVVSSAAIANGFSGYLQVFFSVPTPIAIISIVALMGLIAFWGIEESTIIAGIITLIEIGGLLLVIYSCRDDLLQMNNWEKIITDFSVNDSFSKILAGSFIAFYAFIGFEDMANVVEEVKDPVKTMSLAIITVMIIACLLYFFVSMSVIFAVPIKQLAESNAPFATVMQSKGFSKNIISGISLIAMVNGILIQIIMASRLLYGMSKQKLAPALLSHVHSQTHTPVFSTILITLLVIVGSLLLPIETLAKVASFVLLIVFILVNISLVRIKWKEKQRKMFPIIIPIMGFILSILFLGGQFI